MTEADLIEIDGAEGEGGGQIVRTSLALAALTGRALRLRNIRAGRARPGLMRQHLTCARAVAEIAGATLEGGTIGSSELTLRPPRGTSAGPAMPSGGHFEFAIGTAGSTTLVLQTLLPLLLHADAPSTVRVTGGTHNPAAPPFEFLRDSFVPVLAQTGAAVTVELERHGFVPAGGGAVRMHVTPAPRLSGVELLERGEVTEHRARALVSSLPTKIGERELRTVRKRLNWSEGECAVEQVDAAGPGNALLLTAVSPGGTAVFSGFGMHNVTAERVAAQACGRYRTWLASGAPVCPHLADQVLLPMALAARAGEASVFRTEKLTQHARTHINLVRRLLGVTVTTKDLGRDGVRVHVA